MSQNKRTKSIIQAGLKEQIKQSKGWYFITFVQDLPNARPYGFTLYDEPFVLLRTKSGKLICYLLPLHDEAKNIDNARLTSFFVVERQGMIWLWRESNKAADDSLIPTINSLKSFVEDDSKMLDP